MGVIQAFSSIDLQKQTGDFQRAASREGAVITSHGKPRNVMLSVEEFCRLKRIAFEDVPASLLSGRGKMLRHVEDPLGYDTGDITSTGLRMASDALSGKNESAVDAELNFLRKKFRQLTR